MVVVYQYIGCYVTGYIGCYVTGYIGCYVTGYIGCYVTGYSFGELDIFIIKYVPPYL